MVKTGKELWRLQLQLPEKSLYQLRERWESCHTLAFSPDSKVLAVALEDGSIHLCDMKTGREIRRLFRAVANPVPSQLAFSPNGRYLAASADENIEEKNLEGEERSGFVCIGSARTGTSPSRE
jgi:WD40 repeat protein